MSALTVNILQFLAMLIFQVAKLPKHNKKWCYNVRYFAPVENFGTKLWSAAAAGQ